MANISWLIEMYFLTSELFPNLHVIWRVWSLWPQLGQVNVAIWNIRYLSKVLCMEFLWTMVNSFRADIWTWWIRNLNHHWFSCWLPNNYLNPWWPTVKFSVKFDSIYHNFHTRQWIGKCCMQPIWLGLNVSNIEWYPIQQGSRRLGQTWDVGETHHI